MFFILTYDVNLLSVQNTFTSKDTSFLVDLFYSFPIQPSIFPDWSKIIIINKHKQALQYLGEPLLPGCVW